MTRRLGRRLGGAAVQAGSRGTPPAGAQGALDDKIADYGTADWKGRPLEVVFADISISMKNRLLGEKKTFCWSLGLIFDAEFQMLRDPLEAECENAAEPSLVWKQERGFLSQWVAE